MKFLNEYNIARYLCTIFLVFIVFGLSVQAQHKPGKDKSGKKVEVINLTIKVKNSNGNAVPGALVYSEGITYGHTDENGIVSFNTPVDNLVTISSFGYKKAEVLAGTLIESNSIELVKEILFKATDDIVPMPFMDLKKRDITGSSVVLNSEQLEKYPGADIRNSFTGLVNGLEVREMFGYPGVSAAENLYVDKINFSMRGRNPIFIIDGMQMDLSQMSLDPSEIESVTVLKDVVEKAMFGPSGADGIMLIKTKRGGLNERIINVNVEKGISVIDRMPGWASGAEYASLNNKARTNSGLAPIYSDDAISAYALNNPYDMYHPSVDFKDLILTNTKSYNRMNVSSSGGNDNIKYFGYLGYSGEGDLYKVGSASDYNRLNARSNLDIKINDFLKAKLGIYGGISLRRSPNYGSTFDFLELNSVLNDINTTPPVAFPIYANNDPNLQSPWFAVSSNYGINPIGSLVKNGYYNEQGRNGAANLAFNYDLSKVIKGLSSETYVGINIFNQTRIGKVEDYNAYIASPSKTSAGADTILLTKVHDAIDTDDMSKLDDYYFQKLVVYQSFKHEISIGKANIQNSLTYYISKSTLDGLEEPQRLQNVVWSGLFSFKDKYSVSGVLNYAGTYSFDKGKRYSAFPSLGASWVISEESFMKSLTFIDYIKLRAEAGILGYDSFYSPYFYRDNYASNATGAAFGPYSTNTWFGSTTDGNVYRTTLARKGNPDLTWEKRKELNIGIDALLFSGKLNLDINYYNNLQDGIITQLTGSLADITGLSSSPIRVNYNQIRYTGVEIGLRHSDQSGEFKYSIGVNATLPKAKYVKYDEPDYRNDYQKRQGQPVDAYYALNYLGTFQTDDETLIVPQLFDETLHAGDLKYKDMNDDGVIDDNDKSIVGHTAPRLYYGVNVSLSYKGFDLTLIGTGRAFYDIPLTNSYFWNGWGDNNYSAFVRDNNGGAYPNLKYYKVNNNYTVSDFWLAKGGFFKLQNVELAYNLNEVLRIKGVRGMRIFVRGANLLTISKIKDVDPESINSGITSYPLFTSFTGGIKLTF